MKGQAEPKAGGHTEPLPVAADYLPNRIRFLIHPKLLLADPRPFCDTEEQQLAVRIARFLPLTAVPLADFIWRDYHPGQPLWSSEDEHAKRLHFEALTYTAYRAIVQTDERTNPQESDGEWDEEKFSSLSSGVKAQLGMLCDALGMEEVTDLKDTEDATQSDIVFTLDLARRMGVYYRARTLEQVDGLFAEYLAVALDPDRRNVTAGELENQVGLFRQLCDHLDALLVSTEDEVAFVLSLPSRAAFQYRSRCPNWKLYDTMILSAGTEWYAGPKGHFWFKKPSLRDRGVAAPMRMQDKVRHLLDHASVPTDRQQIKHYIYICCGPKDSTRLSEWFGDWLADFKRPNCLTQEDWVWFHDWLFSDEIGKWLDKVINKCRTFAAWNDEQLARAVADGAYYHSRTFLCYETAQPTCTVEYLSRGLPIFADESLVGGHGFGRQLLDTDCLRQSGCGLVLLPVPLEEHEAIRRAMTIKDEAALYNFGSHVSAWMPFYCPLCFHSYAPEDWVPVPDWMTDLHATADALCPLGHKRLRASRKEAISACTS
jgi:hypothetical protein